MGIDAVVYAKIDRPATEDEIRGWAYQIGAAFGPSRFYIQRPRDPLFSGDEPVGAIAYGEKYDEGAGDFIQDRCVVNARLASRYYGPFYERGDWSFIRSVIAWMRHNMPDGSTVYYGGDCDAGEDIVTDDLMNEIDELFFRSGNQNYHQRYVDQDHQHDCPLCQVAMPQFGFGQKYEMYQCLGCGYKLSTRDSGATWKENEEDLFG